ncbi:MAG TPA: bifunctional DNA primase/polymerase [Gaiellaceae bacterium]|jgi:GTPase SAR1 family protein|nr:bifunctional DNA primase/polymerase [Gaiellaceae bacterium]
MTDVATVQHLADRGWYVIPLRGKTAIVKWSTEATIDEKTIAMWFAGTTSLNVGVVCGPSGLLVVDEDALGGFAKFAASVEQTIPETYTVSTGKGQHFYFDASGCGDLSNSPGPLEAFGCDVRGAGGYVVGAGSTHANGTTYMVVRDVPPAPVPSWLYEALKPAERPAAGTSTDNPFKATALDGVPDVIRAPGGAQAKGSRHQTLVRYAASLQSRNVPWSEALLLFEHVWGRCEQPAGDVLDKTEALGILRDIYASPKFGVSSAYAEQGEPVGYAERMIPGDAFLLDPDPDPDPVWGHGAEVLWSSGEPCLVTGPIGVGKTTLVGRLTRGRLGLDQQVLGYAVKPGRRHVLYLACDRPRQIRRNLARMMHEQDRDVLATRLVFWHGPPPGDLAKTTSLLLDMCHKADADTAIVDGLKDVALELSKDDVGAGLNQAFQRCIAEGIEVVGNHHQRKPVSGATTKPKSLGDLYGSTWIGAGAGTVILVWADKPGQSVLEVSTLKPGIEHVGPLSVVHDFDTGSFEVRDALTLEDVLQASPEPLTIAELGAQLGHGLLDRNEREAIRRRLQRLFRADVVDALDVPAPMGGRPEQRWFWRRR